MPKLDFAVFNLSGCCVFKRKNARMENLECLFSHFSVVDTCSLEKITMQKRVLSIAFSITMNIVECRVI